MFNSDDSTGTITAAASWIADLVVGRAALTIGIIGVAAIGLGLLFGRGTVKRAGNLLLGLSIMFGAPQLALALIESSGPSAPHAKPPSQTTPPPAAPPRIPQPSAFDPYAGASVPQ